MCFTIGRVSLRVFASYALAHLPGCSDILVPPRHTEQHLRGFFVRRVFLFFLPRCYVRGGYEKIGGKEKRERRKVVLVSFSLSLFLSVVGEAQKRRMKREKREGVKILATLEAFSFDAHRIPGRLESLRFP